MTSRIFWLTIPFLVFSNHLFSQDSTAVDTATKIFERVEQEASFPGGVAAWRKFLEQNLNPSVPVDNGAPCGLYTVYAQFVVNRDGRVSGIRCLTNLGYGMEQEVIRILGKSGRWLPAIQNGRPVNAYRKQPVSFQTLQEGFNIYTRTPYTLFTNTENELKLEVDDIKGENLELVISEGAIAKNEDGNYIALVKNPGRVIISVYHKRKKDKPIGEMSFEVRDR
jgi:hypothetical protein